MAILKTSLRHWLVMLGIVLLGIALAIDAGARKPRGEDDAWNAAARVATVALADLPAEAHGTLLLIRKGGPFPYRKDGSVFGNRERRLPAQPRGYYTEYTVPTPGARNRGARRIVAGQGQTGNPATSGEYYYTGDHYTTFHKIRE